MSTTLPLPFRGTRATPGGPIRRLWVVSALSVLTCGTAAVLVGTAAWQHEVRASNQAVISREAQEVGTDVSGELQRYEDLATAAAAYLSPDVGAELHTFAQSVDLATRYPALEGVGYVTDVPAADLTPFLAAMRAGGKPSTVTPAGARSEYCLGSAAEWLPAAAQQPTIPLLGFDLCTISWLRSALDTARRTGGEVVLPERQLGSQFASDFVVIAPDYSGAPTDEQQRVAQLQGWSAALVVGRILLDEAIHESGGHIAVALYAGATATEPALVANSPLHNAGHVAGSGLSTHLGDVPWTVRTTLYSGYPGLSVLTGAIVFLIFGMLVVLLLTAMVLALGRGRARALVEARSTKRFLDESEQRFESLANASPVGIVEVDGGDLSATYVNARLAEIAGRPAAELLGLGWTTSIHPDDLDSFVEVASTAAQRLQVLAVSVRVIRPSGEVRNLRILSGLVSIGTEEMPRFVATVEDVTEEMAAQAELRFQALHDSLTALPNRTLFLDRMGQALRRASRTGGQVAVLFLDLDRFKLVNDSLGHKAGDMLLTEVARRLSATARADETLARLGGDEFTLLLPEVRGVKDATAVATRILGALDDPFDLNGQAIFARVSIGIVLPDADTHPDIILRDADAAMYQAKDNGRGTYAVFQPRLHHRSLERLTLESDLRSGLERGELVVHYQPIVDLRSGLPVAAEALVRWQHPERGLLLPGSFIDLAEETGLVVPLGQRVFADAVAQLQEWDRLADGPTLRGLTINVSAKQLRNPDCISEMCLVTRSMGIEPERLVLEITEATAMNDEAGTRMSLERIEQCGLSVAIDDFGTGYSSLAYLSKLPAIALKVDRSFVTALGAEPEAQEVVAAIVEMAHHLNLRVVAEGIETEAQALAVALLGCDRGQGFWWSPPLAADEFWAWWQAHAAWGRAVVPVQADW